MSRMCTRSLVTRPLCVRTIILFQGNLYSVVDSVEEFGLVLGKSLKGQGLAEGTVLVKPNIGESLHASCGKTTWIVLSHGCKEGDSCFAS